SRTPRSAENGAALRALGAGEDDWALYFGGWLVGRVHMSGGLTRHTFAWSLTGPHTERDIAMRCVSKRLRLLAAVLALGLAGYGRGHVARAAHARAYDAYRASGATRPQDNLSTLPMRFALHHERPAEACGANCRLLVSASGMITAD